jgi:hypothetical protein
MLKHEQLHFVNYQFLSENKGTIFLVVVLTCVVACMNASEDNSIPSIFMHKKCRKEEVGNILPPGTTFNTTLKKHETTEEFCKFLLHFNHHQLFGIFHLILNWHRTNFGPSVLNEAEKLKRPVTLLPDQCSRKFQPLHKMFPAL